MTTIVGIQGDNFALICGDSQLSEIDDSGFITQVVTMRDGTGKVQYNGRYLIGVAGDARACNLLHHAFQPPTAPPNLKGRKLDQFFTVKFIPSMRECFEQYGYAMPDNDLKMHIAEMGSSIIVAVNGTLYTIDPDYSWYSDVNGIYAIGTGAQYAIGVLYALSRKIRPTVNTARQHAMKALAAAARFDPYTGSPYHVHIQDYKKERRPEY
jgi:ATP-dependent protease HslVU (ClpYQ) peptidase subunit